MMYTTTRRKLPAALSSVRRKLVPILGLASLLLVAPSLHAQWAVVDVDAIAQLTKTVSQGAQQIQQIQQQYNLMVKMAQQAKGLFRYRGPQTVWEGFQYADQYATLAEYATGANSGDKNAVRNGYAITTVLADVDHSLSDINMGMANSRRAMYSTQAIMDGNNLAAITAVGAIRSAATQYKNAIDQLESDSEDGNDDTQTQLAVAQRSANAQILGLRAQQDTNALLGEIASQQVAQTKMTRDTIADNTNRSLEQQSAMKDANGLSTGFTDSFRNWKFH